MATLLTSIGKAVWCNRMLSAGTALKFVAWGTGAGTTSSSDSTLFSEDTSGSYARVSGTDTRVTTSTTNDTYQVVATITATANLTITNAGTFDASTSGNIGVKGDFTGVVLNTGDSITFTIKTQLV